VCQIVAGESQQAVLTADDNTEGCFLATEAFLESGADAAFSCVEDGVEPMDYLAERSRSEEGGLPGLIVLDLNMPLTDGRKALAKIKSDPKLKDIPIPS